MLYFRQIDTFSPLAWRSARLAIGTTACRLELIVQSIRKTSMKANCGTCSYILNNMHRVKYSKAIPEYDVNSIIYIYIYIYIYISCIQTHTHTYIYIYIYIYIYGWVVWCGMGMGMSFSRKNNAIFPNRDLWSFKCVSVIFTSCILFTYSSTWGRGLLWCRRNYAKNNINNVTRKIWHRKNTKFHIITNSVPKTKKGVTRINTKITQFCSDTDTLFLYLIHHHRTPVSPKKKLNMYVDLDINK